MCGDRELSIQSGRIENTALKNVKLSFAKVQEIGGKVLNQN